jgi:CRISPR-associated endonuclease/helicase Cas3
MPKISDQRRSDRKERVYELIQTRHAGVKTSEIAEILNVPRRTVDDYLRELEDEYRVWKDGLCWLPMPRQMQRPVTLKPTPEQTVVLYIALRMFVKGSDRRNPIAEKLLLQMAQLASNELHLGADLEQAAAELAQRDTDTSYEDIFLQVVRAYLYRKRLRILYHPYRSEPFETVIEPYLIEPSGFGYGAYAIGYSSLPGALRTYKLERIQAAELTREPFEVPDDFPGLEMLRNAWSIFYGEDTVRVVLRFAPEVIRRVKESNWRGADVDMWEDPQHKGYLCYAFDIADTTDLKPWIRTWGANVEILEPVSLRHEMVGEARALAQLYGWDTAKRDQGADDRRGRFGDIFGGS